MSTKADIQSGLATQLETIKTANGYGTNINKVYVDKIPQGLSFAEFELPAILLISGDDKPEMKHQCYLGNWHFELQCWHNDVSDAVMLQVMRDVYKSIYAGDATAQRNNAFRGIHESIYDITPLPFLSDLNMIEANRCYVANIAVKFSTRLWDL